MSVCSINQWQLTAPVTLTLCLCVGVILLARWVSRQQVFPGRNSFVLLQLTVLWWMGAAALEMAAEVPGCKVFWAQMAWPGIVGVPTFWAVFLWQYVNSHQQALRAGNIALLLVGPLLIWLLALSNPLHQLFYGPATQPISAEQGAPIQYDHGVLFMAAAVYVYALMLFCLWVVLRAAWFSEGVHRRHYLAFVMVTCVPWVANISYVVFGVTLFGFDPTPFCFAFTVVAFAWLILGVRLFDLLPVARHLLVEVLPDPVLVVDGHGRVVEANPAALQLAGLHGAWKGLPLQHWPVFGEPLCQAMGAAGEPLAQLELACAEAFFEVRLRNIERPGKGGMQRLGQMIYLRDVTARHQSEVNLAAALALSEERLSTISELHEQLREQALHDPLTGLYNRRYLAEFFEREQSRALRDRLPLALALIDLDHFKQLNDSHGHLVGDEVLRAVARHLEMNLRSTDAVFRIGGEEFLLILPGVDAAEASQRVESLREQLASVRLPTRAGPLQVTLSAGLALWPQHGHALDELLQAADAALYQAKHAGRNRVQIAPYDTSRPAAEL